MQHSALSSSVFWVVHLHHSSIHVMVLLRDRYRLTLPKVYHYHHIFLFDCMEHCILYCQCRSEYIFIAFHAVFSHCDTVKVPIFFLLHLYSIRMALSCTFHLHPASIVPIEMFVYPFWRLKSTVHMCIPIELYYVFHVIKSANMTWDVMESILLRCIGVAVYLRWYSALHFWCWCVCPTRTRTRSFYRRILLLCDRCVGRFSTSFMFFCLALLPCFYLIFGLSCTEWSSLAACFVLMRAVAVNVVGSRSFNLSLFVVLFIYVSSGDIRSVGVRFVNEYAVAVCPRFSHSKPLTPCVACSIFRHEAVSSSFARFNA